MLLFAGTYLAGVPGQRAVLAAPPEASPAAAAGLATGDVVTAVDGSPVRSWQDLRWRLLRRSELARRLYYGRRTRKKGKRKHRRSKKES